MTNIKDILHYMGYWKFKDDLVSLQQLEEVVKEWASDEKYLSLTMRKTSTGQHGIGFEYKNTESTKESHDAYVESVLDSLKRRFGNGLAGWDVSSSYAKIK